MPPMNSSPVHSANLNGVDVRAVCQDDLVEAPHAIDVRAVAPGGHAVDDRLERRGAVLGADGGAPSGGTRFAVAAAASTRASILSLPTASGEARWDAIRTPQGTVSESFVNRSSPTN